MARPVLFRRALKIINGGLGQLAQGFTVTAENPIYVEGNYNAGTTAASMVGANVPAAIIGDAITLLSNNFSDAVTFLFPNDATNRPATTTGYRFAMVTGKTIPFPKPALWGVQELGSDGGVHNFMKLLENWGNPPGGQQTVRYRGSMVSLYLQQTGDRHLPRRQQHLARRPVPSTSIPTSSRRRCCRRGRRCSGTSTR